jgi:hypothetical protein
VKTQTRNRGWRILLVVGTSVLVLAAVSLYDSEAWVGEVLVTFGEGELRVEQYPHQYPPSLRRHAAEVRFGRTIYGRYVEVGAVPLSGLGLALCAWPIAAMWRGRRRPGDCESCGYDRRGIAVGAPCPECGTPAVHSP